jgi:hypothetical protein
MLLRLGPIGSAHQEEVFALLEPQEQEDVMKAPVVNILRTHSLDKDDVEKLAYGHYMVEVLPPHRFRARLNDLSTFPEEAEATYLLKVLMRREPILDLIQDSSHSLSYTTLIHQTDMSSVELQTIIGHLLKSGLIEIDFSAGAHAQGSWLDPDQAFQLSRLGSDLLAATSG